MSTHGMRDQLGAFRSWKQAQRRLLDELHAWLKQQGLRTFETEHAIRRAIRALREDQVTVAVAGESARGKTELLNALFLAGTGHPLLPAGTDRATACPTEVFCDPARPPSLKLLPIETRRHEYSLTTLCDDDGAWQTFELDLAAPDMLATQMQKLTEWHEVSSRDAVELGLFPADQGHERPTVRIPRWRMARLNIRHPLLECGLRILDTPCLDAISSEPELTYEMLPAAHAVLFVLAADAGVAQADLRAWQQHIARTAQARRLGLTVVLNKVDTLWDETRSSQQIASSIIDRCRTVADTLDIAHEQVYAVSAQQAQVARSLGDAALEQRSGIASLERHMARTMVADRQALIRREHICAVRETIESLETILRGRVERNRQQSAELAGLAEQSDGAVKSLLRATQQDYRNYQSSVRAYRQSLATFERHRMILLTALDARALEPILDRIRSKMTGAWTTFGLRRAMRGLFEDVYARMDLAGRQTQQMRRLLRTIHQRFAAVPHFNLAAPQMFSLIRYQVELGLLAQEAEDFRNSARITMMEQHFVTKRYFRTIVDRIRNIIRRARQDVEHWSGTALAPLSVEVSEYRSALEAKIRDLRETGESRKTIRLRIATLGHEQARLATQLAALHRVQGSLDGPDRPPTIRVSGQN